MDNTHSSISGHYNSNYPFGTVNGIYNPSNQDISSSGSINKLSGYNTSESHLDFNYNFLDSWPTQGFNSDLGLMREVDGELPITPTSIPNPFTMTSNCAESWVSSIQSNQENITATPNLSTSSLQTSPKLSHIQMISHGIWSSPAQASETIPNLNLYTEKVSTSKSEEIEGSGIKKKSTVRGVWTTSEDAVLVEMVSRYGPEKWVRISDHLATRTGKQCRERWHNHLDPTINKGPFTEDEDKIIMKMYSEIGPKWATISKSLNGRPDNTIKNHFNTALMPRRKPKRNANSICSDENDINTKLELESKVQLNSDVESTIFSPKYLYTDTTESLPHPNLLNYNMPIPSVEHILHNNFPLNPEVSTQEKPVKKSRKPKIKKLLSKTLQDIEPKHTTEPKANSIDNCTYPSTETNFNLFKHFQPQQPNIASNIRPFGQEGSLDSMDADLALMMRLGKELGLSINGLV